MSNCQRIQRKDTKVCIGSLNRKISIQSRNIEPPPMSGEDDASVAYGLEFVEQFSVWAMIENVVGESIFDGVSTTETTTTNFYIRYIEGITQEQWILYNNKRYNIKLVKNIDENFKYLLLQTEVTGDVSKESAKR